VEPSLQHSQGDCDRVRTFVDQEKAIGKFDEPLQRLCVELKVKSVSVAWESLRTELHGQQFFCAGPPLRALPRERPCVLLIDFPEQVCLQAPFLKEACPNRRKVRLGIAQRGRRCVDRVGAEDEIVLVRDGRTEHEFGVGSRLELDRFARRLESREIPAPQFIGNRYVA